MTSHKPLIKCIVHVGTRNNRYAYNGLFKSTCDALIDALDRFKGVTGIYVKKVSP